MKELILVTGGAGYIGSHTTVELMEAGYEVVIIDDFSNSMPEVLEGIRRITGRKPLLEQFDLKDGKKVASFFKKYDRLKAVIHFAAKKAVGESVEQPLDYYENNLLSLIHLLRNMKTHPAGALVFSSSCTVYGQPDELPVRESSPVKRALSPYGNTKQISEEIIEDSIRAYQSMQSISLRYFNPIGAHPSAEIGELPTGVPDNLVPFVTQTAAGIRKELKIFGNDYNTPDGTAIRDYIDIVDLARAHVVAIDRLLQHRNKKELEIFNLGTGRGVSVMEVVNTFMETNKVQVNYKIVDRRPGDIEKVWADTSYANRELGWKAERSLADSLQTAWKWEQNYRGSNKGKDHANS